MRELFYKGLGTTDISLNILVPPGNQAANGKTQSTCGIGKNQSARLIKFQPHEGQL